MTSAGPSSGTPLHALALNPSAGRLSCYSTYLFKIQSFEKLYNERVAAALPFFTENSEASLEIKRSQDILKLALEELNWLYNAQFLEKDSSSRKERALTRPEADISWTLMRLEANISWATQQNLELMQKMVNLSSKGFNKLIRPMQLRKFLSVMHRINTSLGRREDVPLYLPLAIKQLLLAGRKPFKTACTLIAMTCLRKSITEITNALDPSNFFRSGDIELQGMEKALEVTTKYPREVLIIVGNHDSGVYDIALAKRLSQRLGCEHHMIMTRKQNALPLRIHPPESAGDVVYVNERDPKSNPIAESILKIKESLKRNDVVSLAVYPEGMVPLTGAQMPLVTKAGAYVIARRLAIELKDQNVPVFLVEEQSNILMHLTQNDLIKAAAKVSNVEIVPTTPLAKGQRDEWVHDHRLQSENRFNVDRGEKMLDILSGKPIPNSMTYEAQGLSCHRSF